MCTIKDKSDLLHLIRVGLKLDLENNNDDLILYQTLSNNFHKYDKDIYKVIKSEIKTTLDCSSISMSDKRKGVSVYA